MNPPLFRFWNRAAILACSLSAVFAASATAQTTATTDPVGFVNVALAGSSDSYVTIPFKRTPEYAGSLTQVTTGVLTATGTPGWTASQFVNTTSTQTPVPPKYYALITSGAKVGTYYTIKANDATTLTLDLAGDTISAADAPSGTTFQVIPYDTLGSIFPAGQGITPSPSHSGASRQSEVLLPDNVNAGINLAPTSTYYYYSGANAPGVGWRQTGASAILANDTVLYPDNYMIVRNNGATSTAVTFMGTVHMGTLKSPIGTLAATTDQDNATALPIPAPLTLSDTKLFESGAFAASASNSGAVRMDELLVWDNTILGINKAPDYVYYYNSSATAPGPGWRKTGASGVIANDIVLSPTRTFVVRKRGLGAPVTTNWTIKPSYVAAETP